MYEFLQNQNVSVSFQWWEHKHSQLHFVHLAQMLSFTRLEIVELKRWWLNKALKEVQPLKAAVMLIVLCSVLRSCKTPSRSRPVQRPDLLSESDLTGCFEENHFSFRGFNKKLRKEDSVRTWPSSRAKEKRGMVTLKLFWFVSLSKMDFLIFLNLNLWQISCFHEQW